jgi:hypothetical protein
MSMLARPTTTLKQAEDIDRGREAEKSSPSSLILFPTFFFGEPPHPQVFDLKAQNVRTQ